MPHIYTISHPFTNDIVYVGATKSLKMRANSHINGSGNNTLISNWIRELQEKYILPKIEPIDTCDSDEAMYLERYWIEQITAWGFSLFNKSKTFKIKKYKAGYVKTDKIEHIVNSELVDPFILKIRRSKKWRVSDFNIGAEHRIEKSKRAIYVISFRQKAKYFNCNDKCLSFIEDGDYLIGTVINKSDIVFKPSHITKSGKKVYYEKKNKPKKIYPVKEPKLVRYGFKNVMIGDIIIIPFERWVSFKVSLKAYNDKFGLRLALKYSPDYENKFLNVTYIDPCNLPSVKRILTNRKGLNFRKRLTPNT